MKNNQGYQKLKELRRKNNMSCKEIASKISISTSYYWQLENKRKNLSYNTALKIAKVFKLKPDDIFYE